MTWTLNLPNKTDSARILRERKTIEIMMQTYCNDCHNTKKGELCTIDQSLFDYAMERIDKCPFFMDKPTCLKCPVHCYKPDRREEIRKIMRYSGPRMLSKHPLLAVLHLVDGLGKRKV